MPYQNEFHSRMTRIVRSAFTEKFSFWDESVVKPLVDRKHESSGQPNQSTYLIPYRNELVPPLYDNGGTCGHILFWNGNFDPVLLPG